MYSKPGPDRLPRIDPHTSVIVMTTLQSGSLRSQDHVPGAPYLRGEALWGDDFTAEEIEQWFRDEEEAYADLRHSSPQAYHYCYHALNRLCHYRYLRAGRFSHALGFGAADGEELLPLASRLDRITIVEPSGQFFRPDIAGVPVTFVKPKADARLDFPDAAFDLITCFGVLHHIPNVSAVMRELARCLQPGGFICLREPSTSMGGWWRPRRGLTRRERGIPARILTGMASGLGLRVVSSVPVTSPFTARVSRLLKLDYFNSAALVRFDRLFCAMLQFNRVYHAATRVQRLRPGSIALVLEKPA
jgi:SAM-dependent methyltransferase